MGVISSNYKLLGGVLCLDFVNTRAWSPAERSYDFFGNYAAMLQWGLQLGVITQPQAGRLDRLAAQHEQEARAVVEKAGLLRLSIYRVFSAAAQGERAPGKDLALLNKVLAEALPHLQVRDEQGRFAWGWVEAERSLDSLLWQVARSAGDLLASERLERVRRCDGCGWLFLDTTRGGQRRWCDMRLCGNRAKARRHYARGKGEV